VGGGIFGETPISPFLVDRNRLYLVCQKEHMKYLCILSLEQIILRSLAGLQLSNRSRLKARCNASKSYVTLQRCL